jgi:hypothetical protein
MKRIALPLSATLSLALALILSSCPADPGATTPTPPQGVQGVVSTLAGSGSNGSANGIGAAASFDRPSAVACDGLNIYVADTMNNQIRKIVIATREVSVFAGSSTAGADDGTGTGASFDQPKDIVTDGTYLYVADFMNHLIRKVSIATREVSTLAGSSSYGATDGTGTGASFCYPFGLALSGGALYVADYGNNEIRKIDLSTKVVSTIAGSTSPGSADGTGTAASFSGPMGLVAEGNYLYVVDNNNCDIRRIDLRNNEVTTFAGTGSAGSLDATGTEAKFTYPRGIASDGTYLYVADTENREIRKMSIATKAVRTLAGSTTAGFTDASGTAARFFRPIKPCYYDGVLYVADEANSAIRVVK